MLSEKRERHLVLGFDPRGHVLVLAHVVFEPAVRVGDLGAVVLRRRCRLSWCPGTSTLGSLACEIETSIAVRTAVTATITQCVRRMRFTPCGRDVDRRDYRGNDERPKRRPSFPKHSADDVQQSCHGERLFQQNLIRRQRVRAMPAPAGKRRHEQYRNVRSRPRTCEASSVPVACGMMTSVSTSTNSSGSAEKRRQPPGRRSRTHLVPGLRQRCVHKGANNVVVFGQEDRTRRAASGSGRGKVAARLGISHLDETTGASLASRVE